MPKPPLTPRREPPPDWTRDLHRAGGRYLACRSETAETRSGPAPRGTASGATAFSGTSTRATHCRLYPNAVVSAVASALLLCTRSGSAVKVLQKADFRQRGSRSTPMPDCRSSSKGAAGVSSSPASTGSSFGDKGVSGSDASSGAPAVVRALAGSWLPALRASSLVAWVASLPCTRSRSARTVSRRGCSW
jgi:hypothetical protein